MPIWKSALLQDKKSGRIAIRPYCKRQDKDGRAGMPNLRKDTRHRKMKNKKGFKDRLKSVLRKDNNDSGYKNGRFANRPYNKDTGYKTQEDCFVIRFVSAAHVTTFIPRNDKSGDRTRAKQNSFCDLERFPGSINRTPTPKD